MNERITDKGYVVVSLINLWIQCSVVRKRVLGGYRGVVPEHITPRDVKRPEWKATREGESIRRGRVTGGEISDLWVWTRLESRKRDHQEGQTSWEEGLWVYRTRESGNVQT